MGDLPKESVEELREQLALARERIATLESRIEAESKDKRKKADWVYAALESAGVGVWDWDITRNVVSWTDATLRIYSVDRETFAGTIESFMDLVPEEDRASVKARIGRVFEQHEPEYFVEHRVRRPDGQLRWVRGYGFGYFDEQKRPYHLAGVVFDITDEKREQEERQALAQQIIDTQRETLRQIGAPIVPIGPRVLALPLIGTLTPERANLVIEELLRAVSERSAEVIILDVTGVPTVDTDVADGLIRAAQAVRLLGAEVVMTGVQPPVAKALVELGVDMGAFVTKADLQSGIAWAARRERGGDLKPQAARRRP
ncbi:PAS domain-containing protein [Polyangium aurulentum]|uniref:PAS domain-containing protein n=1 Tax=Polyangium aurulentum TaxID=2567896 RepID=UPI0010ADB2DD|nr:PAS domain-containing protein [Polyangium aurulentum]UQA54674.1 PAS domain-containing protein [Polyangium aurulentum]